MNTKKKNDKSNFLAAMLLLLSGFFVFLFMLPDASQKQSSASIAQTKQFEEKVNKHLFNTSQRMQLERERMKIEAAQLENQGQNLKLAPQGEEIHHLDFSRDPRAEALLKELGREASEPGYPSSAHEQVQTDLFEAQQYQKYSEEYKKEYARQFVENARRAGYLIKLSEDYKIIGIRPLRKPADNFQLFNSQGGGAQ